MSFPIIFGGGRPGVPILRPGSLSPQVSFTRASSASYLDGTGTLQTVGANVPRFDGTANRLLIEGARTNLFLHSGTPLTQTLTLAAGTYAVSVAGTGSLTSAAGTAVGTSFGPATAASPDTFTVTTAGTVVFTVAGSLTSAQVELGASPSSYIATTSTSTTRAVDTALYTAPSVLPGNVTVYGTASCPQMASAAMAQYVIEFNALNSGGNTNNRIALRNMPGATTIAAVPVVGGALGASISFGTLTPGIPFKFAMTWNTTTGALRGTINGAPPSGEVGALPPGLQYVSLGNTTAGAPATPLFGDLGPVMIIPGLFASDALLQGLTH